jgi:arginine/lysine/ornithine decarboxylase
MIKPIILKKLLEDEAITIEKADLVQTVHSAMTQFHVTQTNLRLLSQIKRIMEENATLSKQVQLYTGIKSETSKFKF